MSMADFESLIDLAAERLGGAVLTANDEFFAEKENLLRASKPVFIEGKYTDRGKWMDGWETRRRRTPGHDWCLVRLGLPGVIKGLVVDTSFFRGNYPDHCSVEACAFDGNPTVDSLLDGANEWVEILPPVALAGDSRNLFEVHSISRFTHLRLKIFPMAVSRVCGCTARWSPIGGDWAGTGASWIWGRSKTVRWRWVAAMNFLARDTICSCPASGAT
jgi:allantoicase